MSKHEFICKQCGFCCKTAGGFGIVASKQDIERWVLEGRYDILDFVDDWKSCLDSDNENIGRDFDAVVGDKPCVFLRRIGKIYSCSIYKTRPQLCREYPYVDGKLCPTEIKKCKGIVRT